MHEDRVESRDRANLWRLVSRCAYNRSDPVKRINSAFFLELGGHLNQLKGVKEKSAWMDHYFSFMMTESMLGDLIDEHEPVELTYCLNERKATARLFDPSDER